jgi:hypothetical protein
LPPRPRAADLGPDLRALIEESEPAPVLPNGHDPLAAPTPTEPEAPQFTRERVDALRAQLKANDYQPVPVKTGDKHPVEKDWQLRTEVPVFQPSTASTGILTRGLRAFDIDIDDPEKASIARRGGGGVGGGARARADPRQARSSRRGYLRPTNYRPNQASRIDEIRRTGGAMARPPAPRENCVVAPLSGWLASHRAAAPPGQAGQARHKPQAQGGIHKTKQVMTPRRERRFGGLTFGSNKGTRQ